MGDARIQVINRFRIRKVNQGGPTGDLGTVSPDG